MAAISFIVCLLSFTNAVGGTMTLTSPNGGETWTVGTTNTITWTSDVIGNVRISLLKGGNQYKLITFATPNDGSFDWVIPALIATGNDYTIKISSCTSAVMFSDVSDADFSIIGGSGSTVTVITPNGGETFTAGTTNTVIWSSDIIGNMKITLLRNGLHYALISSATPNDGNFDWIIPAGLAVGSEYQVKIASAAYPLIYDVSDANFSVVPGGGTSVTVIAPNGGEEFAAGTTNTITWTSDLTGYLRITLLKGGVDFSLISAKTANDGSFDWNIPAAFVSGNDFTVKISSCTNTLVSDVSDADFTITGGSGSSVAVLSPNGGETFTAGTTNPITWESDIVGDVRISLLKEGLHYALISSGTPNDGSFDWNIPARLAAGTEYTVKVASSAYPLIYDVSDASFSIVAGGGTSVIVTSPNGGEEFAAGTPNTITWTSDLTGYLRISLLKDGVYFSMISGRTVNTGSFDWLIPESIASGTGYKVMISSCINPEINDVSDSDFTITGGGGSTITVLSPNGGEAFTAGTTNTITWESDIVGNVRISLLKGGLQYTLISSGTPNDGSFDWLVPAGLAVGTEYTVKVASSSFPLMYDVSDANFSIVSGGGNSVTVISPNGGEEFVAGTTNTITWTSDITGYLRITLLKGGIQYAVIAGAVPNTGSRNWLIPATIVDGTDYTVKISSCTNVLATDVSDADFSIVSADNSKFGITQNADFKSSISAEATASPVLSLYPNPATNVINVVSDRGINHVWLLNNLGGQVFEMESNAIQLQLNVTDFKKGIYFVKIDTEGMITTHKVFIK